MQYNLREFVRTHVILTPGACGRQVLGRTCCHHFRRITGIAGIAGITGIAGIMPRPQYLTTLPVIWAKMLGKPPPKSPPGASGSLWGRSGHILLVLREKKAPAGALKTRIGSFEENMKNVDFWKLLGMGWPGVGNVPRPCGSILHLSRGSQEPYRKNKKNVFYITPDIPPRRPDIRENLSSLIRSSSMCW